MAASNGLRTLLTLAIPIALLPGPKWLGTGWGFWALVLMTLLESGLTKFFAPCRAGCDPPSGADASTDGGQLRVPDHQHGHDDRRVPLGEPILCLLKAPLGQGGPAGEESFCCCRSATAARLSSSFRFRLRRAQSRDRIAASGEIQGGPVPDRSTAPRTRGAGASCSALQPVGGAVCAGYQSRVRRAGTETDALFVPALAMSGGGMQLAPLWSPSLAIFPAAECCPAPDSGPWPGR